MYLRSPLLLGLALLAVISLPNVRAEDESKEPTLEEIHKLIRQNVSTGIANFTVTFNRLCSASSPKKNLIFSPLNIYNGLAVLLAGAAGDTEDELSEVLGLPIPSDAPQLTEVTHDVIGNVLKSVQISQYVTVNMAAGVFAKDGLQPTKAYQERLTKNYTSEFMNVDFANESATDIVNKWVSNKTKNRIPQLFASGIPSNTELLLTTVLYFAGTWKHVFPERWTEIDNFTISPSEIISVKMMSNLKQVPYYDNTPQGYEVMGLHYRGADCATMFFILPTMDRTLDSLTIQPADIHSIVNASLENTTFVEYKVPQIKLSWNSDISNKLKDLGAKTMFGNADFSKMVSDSSLMVSTVQHAAEIEINEHGTVASAATGIIFTKMANIMPWGETVKFVLDRPFSLFIYHHNTSTILFYGNVYNPNGKY